jgi:hypothetical protein
MCETCNHALGIGELAARRDERYARLMVAKMAWGECWRCVGRKGIERLEQEVEDGPSGCAGAAGKSWRACRIAFLIVRTLERLLSRRDPIGIPAASCLPRPSLRFTGADRREA